MIQVKICGLSTPAAIDAAAKGGASHVGFIFYPPSPRHVTPAQAAGLAARLPEHVACVGVMVDPDNALIDAALNALPLAALQLHGVTPARAAELRNRRAIWAAVGVKTSADLRVAQDFAGAADRLLYDAKAPPGDLPGGRGARFDWRLLAGLTHALPWALSGGLDADNLGEAVRVTGARMVDVSSGVERAPGIKDVDKIAAFLHAARQL